VTVAILGGVITGVYAGVIFGFGALIGTEGVGFDLQVAAAVAVAMAFYPARRRAQRLANRLVFGERATPYEVLARFSHRAAETPAEELIERIPQLIVDGTGAVEATLWVRDRDQFRIGAVWPESAFRMPIPAEGGFLDLEADFSLPVHHAGELLGGLSLVKARNESMVPAETELLRSLASGLGVALRNANLTAELKTQVEALEASRDRVLAAADEARRALERDLDSGPQQRLVALKVMLGPIRKQAEQAGAEKTSAILRQLEDEAGSAIRSVREFAGGIYPPLLEAEGLRAAVAQQAQRSGLPVTVDAGDVGRYPREVEAAVYFTILESLQNAAKYANPTEVEVTITDDGGSLAFAIRDDGVGFDPETAPRGSGLSNMEDRIDSVGGRLRVDSHPGAGTSVRGEIPITAQVDV
jgi:signal transduction histidine kinase